MEPVANACFEGCVGLGLVTNEDTDRAAESPATGPDSKTLPRNVTELQFGDQVIGSRGGDTTLRGWKLNTCFHVNEVLHPECLDRLNLAQRNHDRIPVRVVQRVVRTQYDKR